MKNKETKIIIASVFVAGVCSIIYELLIATASSYFLGDSIKQFSITIGAYMAAMGVGSYLSRLVPDNNLLPIFIKFELLLGLVGGLSVPLLYASFAYTQYFQLSSISLTLLIGVFIGLEIPLLSRLLERYYTLKINISNVLSVDYLGALIATLVFPFILLPTLGTFSTSIFFGLINMSIAIMLLLCFGEAMGKKAKKLLWLNTVVVTGVLLLGLVFAQSLLSQWSNSLYDDRIIYTKETHYQNIVMTKNKNDVRLFLNGNLQFSSTDEYRYHEMLVHAPISLSKTPSRVLFLGGGDGLGVREILKYPQVEQITLVDLDPEILLLGKENPHVVTANANSLNHPLVTLVPGDAFRFLVENQSPYDLIVVDLPDPNNPSLARLYSREFYKLVAKNLSVDGLFITQATSPFFARKAFWTIEASIAAAGFQHVMPLHVNVPSFGDWGFVIGAKSPLSLKPLQADVSTRFLTDERLLSAMHFGKDTGKVAAEPSTIDKPIVLGHYLSGWRYWN